jgi:hypothetical protein
LLAGLVERLLELRLLMEHLRLFHTSKVERAAAAVLIGLDRAEETVEQEDGLAVVAVVAGLAMTQLDL